MDRHKYQRMKLPKEMHRPTKVESDKKCKKICKIYDKIIKEQLREYGL